VIHHHQRSFVETLRERGLLQPTRRTPGPDRDADRRPCRPQFTHEFTLQRLERRDPLVPVEHQPGHPEHLVAGATHRERVEHGRDVDGQRAVGEVAEVDDPGDQTSIIGKHVVNREVAVDHLSAQRRPAWCDRVVVPAKHGVHRGALRPIRHRGQHGSHARGVLDVPWQVPDRAGVDKAA
jgi:hypothetical protein